MIKSANKLYRLLEEAKKELYPGCKEVTKVSFMEAVQDHPAPIAPTLATTSLIPMPRRWVRRNISNDDLIASIDQVTDRLAECHLLVGLVLDQSRASD